MWRGYYPAQVMFPAAHRLDGDRWKEYLDGILTTRMVQSGTLILENRPVRIFVVVESNLRR